MERKNAWLTYTDADKAALEAVSARYTDYLSKGKTERECVKLAIAMAEEEDIISTVTVSPDDDDVIEL